MHGRRLGPALRYELHRGHRHRLQRARRRQPDLRREERSAQHGAGVRRRRLGALAVLDEPGDEPVVSAREQLRVQHGRSVRDVVRKPAVQHRRGDAERRVSVRLGEHLSGSVSAWHGRSAGAALVGGGRRRQPERLHELRRHVRGWRRARRLQRPRRVRDARQQHGARQVARRPGVQLQRVDDTGELVQPREHGQLRAAPRGRDAARRAPERGVRLHQPDPDGRPAGDVSAVLRHPDHGRRRELRRQPEHGGRHAPDERHLDVRGRPRDQLRLARDAEQHRDVGRHRRGSCGRGYGILCGRSRDAVRRSRRHRAALAPRRDVQWRRRRLRHAHGRGLHALLQLERRGISTDADALHEPRRDAL